jgi:uncharacterized membrane protein YjjB (DUF3815 family)
MKRSLLRILLVVYLFPLVLVCGSLSVPPRDLLLFALMFAVAVAGTILSFKESRKWRAVWTAALVVALLGGALELFAGKRIARERSNNENSATPTNR